jgi:branched-chain amino acid transport system permease protein
MRKVVLALCMVLCTLPLWAYYLDAPYIVSLATRALILSLAVIGLDLMIGYSGLINLSHAAFFGIGGYFAIVLSTGASAPGAGALIQLLGQDLAITGIAALAVVAFVALMIGYLALRVRGVQFIMITLAFSQMFSVLALLMPGYGGDEGLRIASWPPFLGLKVSSGMAVYYLALGSAVGGFFLAQAIVCSRFGAVVVGCKQNERRMKFIGFNTEAYLLSMFVISALFAGLSGVLLAIHNKFVEPGSLSWELSADMLVMLLVGGLGRLYGAVVGVFIYLALEQSLAGVVEDWRLLLGVVLLLVVLFVRGGVIGWLEARKGWLASFESSNQWSRLWHKKHFSR